MNTLEKYLNILSNVFAVRRAPGHAFFKFYNLYRKIADIRRKTRTKTKGELKKRHILTFAAKFLTQLTDVLILQKLSIL